MCCCLSLQYYRLVFQVVRGLRKLFDSNEKRPGRVLVPERGALVRALLQGPKGFYLLLGAYLAVSGPTVCPLRRHIRASNSAVFFSSSARAAARACSSSSSCSNCRCARRRTDGSGWVSAVRRSSPTIRCLTSGLGLSDMNLLLAAVCVFSDRNRLLAGMVVFAITHPLLVYRRHIMVLSCPLCRPQRN